VAEVPAKVPATATLAVAAIGIYLFISASFHDTGGKELPSGKLILHS
jgi:hypothetical protein